MSEITLEWIAATLKAEIVNPQPRPVRGFALDSRELKPNEIFIALRGRRTDGHLFLREAFARGASGAIISQERLELAHRLPNLIPVPNPAEALWELARAYRADHRATFIGITGSSGKTTTKELLCEMLSQRYRAYRAPKSYNTELGLPLALLNMPPEAEIGVFELGLQRPGEVAELADLLQPQVGVLTSIGDAHLGFFADREELAHNKWELIARLPPDGLAVLNYDSPYLRPWAEGLQRKVSFALESEADYRAEAIDDTQLQGLRFTLRTPREPKLKLELETKLLGRFNLYNVLAAIVVAHSLGVSLDDIAETLRGFRPVAHRMELKESRIGLIIDDSYNANPTSMEAALAALARLETSKRKVAVLGDMLELGDQALEAHRALAQHIVDSGVKFAFLVGELTATTLDALRRSGWPGRAFHAKDQQELEQLLRAELPDGENLILVKGSRALALDRVVAALCD